MSELIHNGETPDGADVTTNGTLVLAARISRKVAVFTNSSDAGIFLALKNSTDGTTNQAVLNSGIYLAANGGAYEINSTNLYKGEVWAIHGGAGTKRLCVQQGS